ncbi:chorismate mutase [Cetobacterium sp.]|uniref:chorismate mutase n=1 Tax=Cetobacterium sp. TaxID=2071632 RepID=UPI003F668822
MKWGIKITTNINKLREEIDNIDEQIIELVLKRMKVVHEVGVTKSKDNTRIYVPEREISIYNRLSNISGISSEDIAHFYTEIISFCRKLEGILNVGIKDDKHSLLGVKKLFGEHVNPIIIQNFNSLDLNSTKYILSIIDDEVLEFIKINDWSIINKVNVLNETLYLFSCYKNTTLKNNNSNNNCKTKITVEGEQND